MFRLFFVVGLACIATAQDLGGDFGLTLLVSVPSPPIPVRADGKYLLVYELHVVAQYKPVHLLRVEAWGATRIGILEGQSLAQSIQRIARQRRFRQAKRAFRMQSGRRFPRRQTRGRQCSRSLPSK